MVKLVKKCHVTTLYYLRLCSISSRWPVVPNFCPWATRKSYFFRTNHMLGILDFISSEHWAAFQFFLAHSYLV